LLVEALRYRSRGATAFRNRARGARPAGRPGRGTLAEDGISAVATCSSSTTTRSRTAALTSKTGLSRRSGGTCCGSGSALDPFGVVLIVSAKSPAPTRPRHPM